MFMSRCPALSERRRNNMENKNTMILPWDPASSSGYLGLGTEGGGDMFASSCTAEKNTLSFCRSSCSSLRFSVEPWSECPLLPNCCLPCCWKHVSACACVRRYISDPASSESIAGTGNSPALRTLPSEACTASSRARNGCGCPVSSDSEHFISSLWEALALVCSLETNVSSVSTGEVWMLWLCACLIAWIISVTSSDFFQSALCLGDGARVRVPVWTLSDSHCMGGIGGSGGVVSSLASSEQGFSGKALARFRTRLPGNSRFLESGVVHVSGVLLLLLLLLHRSVEGSSCWWCLSASTDTLQGMLSWCCK